MKSRIAVSARRLQGQKGAVTISYLYPFTSAPTAAQMQNQPFNTVTATVSATAAGDTSAVITHNFGLSAAEITQGFPFPLIIGQSDETTSPWYESSENPNFTVIQKNTLGTGPAVKVAIVRPHSITR